MPAQDVSVSATFEEVAAKVNFQVKAGTGAETIKLTSVSDPQTSYTATAIAAAASLETPVQVEAASVPETASIANDGFELMADKTDKYEIKEVLYGTADNDSLEQATKVDKQIDFSGDEHEETGVSFSDANKNTQYNIGDSVLKANTSAAWEKNFTEPVTKGIVHFSADYSVSANNNGTFKIVDGDGNAIYESSDATASKNDTVNVAKINGQSISNWVRNPRTAGYNIDLEIDLDKKTVKYTAIVSSGENSVSTLSDTIEGLTATSVKGLKVEKTSYGCYLDNVALWYEESTEVLHPYTITYQLEGGDTVKTAQGSVAANTVIPVEKSFWVDDTKKYFATEGAEESLTVTADGPNTWTVTVREANKYTLKVNATGELKKTVTEKTVIEGEDYSYGFPMFVVDENNIAYQATANGSGAYYGGSGTNMSADVNISVAYTRTGNEDVVLLDDLDDSNAQNASVRASNCLARDNAAYTSEDIAAGTYDVFINAQSKGRGSSITFGDKTLIKSFTDAEGTNSKDNSTEERTTDDNQGFLNGAWHSKTFEDITIAAPGKITLTAGGSGTYDDLDVVLVSSTTPIPTHNFTEIPEGEYTIEVTPQEGKEVRAIKVNGEDATGEKKITVKKDDEGKVVIKIETQDAAE